MSDEIKKIDEIKSIISSVSSDNLNQTVAGVKIGNFNYKKETEAVKKNRQKIDELIYELRKNISLLAQETKLGHQSGKLSIALDYYANRHEKTTEKKQEKVIAKQASKVKADKLYSDSKRKISKKIYQGVKKVDKKTYDALSRRFKLHKVYIGENIRDIKKSIEEYYGAGKHLDIDLQMLGKAQAEYCQSFEDYMEKTFPKAPKSPATLKVQELLQLDNYARNHNYSIPGMIEVKKHCRTIIGVERDCQYLVTLTKLFDKSPVNQSNMYKELNHLVSEIRKNQDILLKKLEEICHKHKINETLEEISYLKKIDHNIKSIEEERVRAQRANADLTHYDDIIARLKAQRERLLGKTPENKSVVSHDEVLETLNTREVPVMNEGNNSSALPKEEDYTIKDNFTYNADQRTYLYAQYLAEIADKKIDLIPFSSYITTFYPKLAPLAEVELKREAMVSRLYAEYQEYINYNLANGKISFQEYASKIHGIQNIEMPVEALESVARAR